MKANNAVWTPKPIHRPYTQTFTPPEKQMPLLGIKPAAPPPSWAPSRDVIPLLHLNVHLLPYPGLSQVCTTGGIHPSPLPQPLNILVRITPCPNKEVVGCGVAAGSDILGVATGKSVVFSSHCHHNVGWTFPGRLVMGHGHDPARLSCVVIRYQTVLHW